IDIFICSNQLLLSLLQTEKNCMVVNYIIYCAEYIICAGDYYRLVHIFSMAPLKMQSIHPSRINVIVDVQVVITSPGVVEALLVVSLPVTFAATLNLQYDANGNLVTGDGKYRVYNSFNQLAEIRNGSASDGTLLEDYVYHPTEERVYLKHTYEAGAVKDTIIYYTKTFVRIENSSGTYDYTYVYHEGQLVAQLNPDGSKYFMHDDHLGSTSTITNSTGSVIESTTYTPYGEILSGGSASRFDYTGKEYSSFVGDYDFNAKKYNPEWGLFIQPDTLIPNVYDPPALTTFLGIQTPD
ncbi:MAG: hypothetical protein Q8R37_02680, partial [Nanoarchaeota archaeon]|nr:hypothetical protein [Nanoarchaeota archaeon]